MKAQQWLIKAWLFSMGFVYVLDLPFSNTKVQVTEFIVLLMFGVWLLSGRKTPWPKKAALNIRRTQFYLFEGATLLFLAIALLATLMHPTRAAILENVGYVYLFVCSLLVQWLLQEEKSSLLFFQQSFFQLGLILAGLNMLIFAGYLSGLDVLNPLVEAKPLPFLGIVPRVKGWMPSVNLLADLMALCWWMAVAQDAKSGKYARSLFILVGLILTASKSLMIIIPLGFYLWVKNRKENKKIRFRASGILVLISIGLYLFFTHVLIQRSVPDQDANPSYLTGTILAETDKLVFLETSYLRLKKLQFLAASEHPVLGVGPGNFNAFLKQAKEKGQYPEHLPEYDPHSTLGGTLAEAGILGLLALLIWVGVIIYVTRKVTEKNKAHLFYSALSCYLIFMGIQTLTTDMLNFRHLWVCLGILAWDFKRSQTVIFSAIGKG